MEYAALLPISLSMIVYIILGIILVIKALRGHRKGYKTDLFWFIAKILFWVSYVVISSVLFTREFIENEGLFGAIKSLGLDTGESTNVVEYGTTVVSTSLNIDVSAFDNDALMNTVFAIVQVLLKIVFLPVYALLYFFIVWLVYVIFFKRHFKPKKVNIEKFKAKVEKDKKLDADGKAKAIEKAEKKNKKCKNVKRIGWITGLVRGFVSCAVFLSIFNSLINVLPSLQSSNDNYSADANGESEEETTTTMSLYDLICEKYPTLKDVCDYISEYQNNNLAHITDIKVGNQTLDAYVVNLVLEGKSEDVTFSIHDEVASIVKIAEYACVLTNGFDINNTDFLALDDTQVDCLKNIILVLSDDQLVKNLGEAAIGVALSLDSVKDMLPENYELPEEEIKGIDISEELKNVAYMVEDVYALAGDGKEIDFNNLDPDRVESLITKIASLQSVQVICDVGSSIAVDMLFVEKDEAGNVTNQETLDRIKSNLADVVWKDDITDLSTLYGKYLDLGLASKLEDENYKGEDGTTNFVKILTSIKNDKLETIVDTIFETSFLTAVLPDVMEIVKTKYIPDDYKDMISPNITTTKGWQGEIKSLLSIIKELTNDGADPIETMDNLDYSIFKNISTETIVNSELLSYAMIGILVDAGNGKGLAGEALGDFISMPSYLKEPADATTHYYDAKWYSKSDKHSTSPEDGELEVMLDALKNIAASVSSLDNIMGSIPDILGAIDPTSVEKSEVLHYTVSTLLLDKAGDFIKVPVDSFMSEEELGETDKNLDIIKASEISDIIDILKDKNIFDLKKLMVYKYTDENEVVTSLNSEEYEALSEEEKAKYTAEFDTNLDINGITGILTSKTLYDPDSTDANKDANLNKLFGSSILRTTISYFINEYAGDIITMPTTDGSYAMVDVYVAGKDATDTEPAVASSSETMKVLSVDECKNLVKAIDILDIDFETISDDPLSLMDTFKNNNKAQKIFATTIDDAANPDYSETLHFTVSTLLLDKAGDFLKVPVDAFMSDAELDGNEENLDVIKSSEIVEILEILSDENIFNMNSLMKYTNKNDSTTLTYEEYKVLTEDEKANYSREFDSNLDINGITDILTSKTLYDPDSTDANKDANLNKLFGSSILRTTISYFINEYAGDIIVMPTIDGSYAMVDVYVAGKDATDTEPEIPSSSETMKVLSLNECKNLVKAIDILDIDFETISDDPLSLMDSFKDNNNAKKIFATTIDDVANPDYSGTFHFTVSKVLLDNAGDFLKVPVDAFMSDAELGGNEEDLDVIKSSEIVEILEILSDENIFNMNSLMKYTNKNDSTTLTYEEYKLLTEDEKANYSREFDSNLDIGGITDVLTSKTLYDPDSTDANKDANLDKLFGSSILRTTISYFINEYAGDFIVMPSSADSYAMVDVYVAGKDATDTEPAVASSSETMKILSLSESKNLVKTIDILDLDFEVLSDDPLSIVDSFKDDDGNYVDTNTAKIFASTIASNPNPDYSETFHATLSKFVFDFASDNSSNDFSVRIPDEAKDGSYLEFNEIDAFLKGMCAIDINELVNGGNISIVSLIYDNQNINEAFDSKIIRYSVTNYLENSNATKGLLTIPTAGDAITVLTYEGESVNVLTKVELSNIFDGFKSLIDEQAAYLNVEAKDLSDDDLMDPCAIAIKNASDDMFASVVIRGLVTSKIDSMGGSMGIIIPADDYDNVTSTIKATELTNLMSGLCEITGGGKVSELDIDKDKLINDLSSMSDEKINSIFASNILRASMTKSVQGVSAIKIPHDVTVIIEGELDKDGEDIDILLADEIVKLVKLFNEIGGDNKSLDTLNVNTLSIDSLITMMDKLKDGDETGVKISGIFRATLADKLLSLNSDGSIYIGIEGNFITAENVNLIEYDNTYEVSKTNYTNINYIKYSEIEKIFASMQTLLGSDSSASLTSLNGSSFTSNTSSMLSFSDAQITTLFASDIMVNTMSKIVSDMFGGANTTLKYLDVNDNATINEPYRYTRYNLTRRELTNFYKAIQVVCGGDSSKDIDQLDLDFEGIVTGLDTAKIDTLVSSQLLSYNIKNYLIELNTSSFGNMLALSNLTDCADHTPTVCAHDYDRYYYSTKKVAGDDYATAENDLAGLLNSFAKIYGEEDGKYVDAFKDTQNASITALMSKDFINIICGEGSSNVIVDSLPNMVKQFQTRVTGLVANINNMITTANETLTLLGQPTYDTINLTFYIPDRFYETTKFATYDDWQEYWYGDLEDTEDGYQSGQLYKFFNVINVASGIDNVSKINDLKMAINNCELINLA